MQQALVKTTSGSIQRAPRRALLIASLAIHTPRGKGAQQALQHDAVTVSHPG